MEVKFRKQPRQGGSERPAFRKHLPSGAFHGADRQFRQMCNGAKSQRSAAIEESSF
jgi:hypothetical protein